MSEQTTESPAFIAKPDDSPEQRLAAYKCALTQILTANGWKRGSAKARAAEYAFIIGITSAGHGSPFLQICQLSGRSILD